MYMQVYRLHNAHEQQKFEIIRILLYIQLYITRQAQPIKAALTDVTKHSQPKNRNCIKMSTQSQVNQEIVNLMKPHLTQID